MYKVRIKSADGHDYFLDLQGPVVDIKVEEIKPAPTLTFHELRRTGRTCAAVDLCRKVGGVLVTHNRQAAEIFSALHNVECVSVTSPYLKQTIQMRGKFVVDHAVWELGYPADLERLRAIIKDANYA